MAIRQLLDVRDGNHAALDPSCAKLESRNVFSDLGERLGQRYRAVMV